MTLAATVRAAGAEIGAGHEPLFLADIGTFFNQDLDRGMALIDGVAEAGLAFVKAEVLHDASICLDVDVDELITSRDLQVSRERYRSVIERKVLPLAAYARLFDHARARGLELALSVYDDVGLAFALEQRAALIKIASSNIVHQPLIVAAAGSGLPVLLDTGRSTISEVVRAVEWFTGAGGRNLVIEHSPPAPPAPVAEHDLGMIGVLREIFGCPVGLSDHHSGDEMLYAAAALGAHVLEKGVCPDDALRDQDIGHALPIGALREVVRKCAHVHVATRRRPRSFARPGHPNPARMGVIAARDLRAAQRIERSDLAFAFPASGVPVEHTGRVIGSVLRGAVAKGEPVLWSNVILEDE